jgi:nicotinate-nucleotide adenylyltransferase
VPAIGILGGTFNPPHVGHLALARDAREELGLERVLLMPLHTPAHKTVGADPGPEHRLAMCRLACLHETGISASDMEVARGGPSYTVDTLREIHDEQPGVELTLIVGADTARTLPTWREPGAVLELARLAVAIRPGTGREEVREALARAAGPAPGPVADRTSFLSMSPIEASSSEARRRLAAGEPVEGLLAPEVAAYIAEHDLYAAERRVAR